MKHFQSKVKAGVLKTERICCEVPGEGCLSALCIWQQHIPDRAYLSPHLHTWIYTALMVLGNFTLPSKYKL